MKPGELERVRAYLEHVARSIAFSATVLMSVEDDHVFVTVVAPSGNRHSIFQEIYLVALRQEALIDGLGDFELHVQVVG